MGTESAVLEEWRATLSQPEKERVGVTEKASYYDSVYRWQESLSAGSFPAFETRKGDTGLT